MAPEQKYYEPIRTELQSIFKQNWKDKENAQIHLELTHHSESKIIDELIVDEVRKQFLRHKPDIAGFVNHQHDEGATNRIIVEVKNRNLRLDDFYQMMKYADLFQATYSFLITTGNIPDNLIEFYKSRIAPIEEDLHSGHSHGIVLLEFSRTVGRFQKYATHPESGAIHITEIIKNRFDSDS